MAVSIRKVEKEVHETGVGQSNRTEVHYEIGGEVDGVFVPFASVSEARVADFAQRAEREKATDPTKAK